MLVPCHQHPDEQAKPGHDAQLLGGDEDLQRAKRARSPSVHRWAPARGRPRLRAMERSRWAGGAPTRDCSPLINSMRRTTCGRAARAGGVHMQALATKRRRRLPPPAAASAPSYSHPGARCGANPPRPKLTSSLQSVCCGGPPPPPSWKKSASGPRPLPSLSTGSVGPAQLPSLGPGWHMGSPVASVIIGSVLRPSQAALLLAPSPPNMYVHRSTVQFSSAAKKPQYCCASCWGAGGQGCWELSGCTKNHAQLSSILQSCPSVQGKRRSWAGSSGLDMYAPGATWGSLRRGAPSPSLDT